MSAYDEILKMLEEGEKVEGIVFGPFSWGGVPKDGEQWDYGCDEPGEETGEEPPVPFHLRGKVLTLEEVRQYMNGWSFYNGCGVPKCYATYIWTNKRVFWVAAYEGETRLEFMPRDPTVCIPAMSGH